MLIKPAATRTSDVMALETLLKRSDVAADARRRIQEELRTLAAGVKAEDDAAYQIEFYCGTSPNIMTLHDLRLEHNGRVAQIDHLILNRLLEIYVCESKSFAHGVSINDHGEWSTGYRNNSRGIASPIEQNLRHAEVLRDVLASGRVALPKRFGITLMPEIRPLVVVSSRARVTRPRVRVPGLDSVINVDQLMSTIDRAVDEKLSRAFEHGNVGALLAVGKAVGRETLERLARELAALHSPISFDWPAKFGLKAEQAQPHSMGFVAVSCGSCTRPVSQKVAAYSQANRARFGNLILCWDCQRTANRNRP
jgi:nuclease-like protein